MLRMQLVCQWPFSSPPQLLSNIKYAQPIDRPMSTTMMDVISWGCFISFYVLITSQSLEGYMRKARHSLLVLSFSSVIIKPNSPFKSNKWKWINLWNKSGPSHECSSKKMMRCRFCLMMFMHFCCHILFCLTWTISQNKHTKAGCDID